MSTTATAVDVIHARHRDALAPHRDRPATAEQFRDVVADAMRWTFPRLSATERDDLASEVRERIARKHGWAPPMSALSRPILANLAGAAWRDKRGRIADVKDASAATDAAEYGGAFSALAATDLPAADVEWEAVASALGYPDPASAEATAIYAALGGYGDGAELARVLGISPETARKRLERGRERLARRYPDPDSLADALADAGAADRPLLAGPVPADGRKRLAVTLANGRTGRLAPITVPLAAGERSLLARLVTTNRTPVSDSRVQLDSVRRFWLALLDRLAPTTTAGHAAKIDREPRQDAPRAEAGPAALMRCQPERVALKVRREYRAAGRPMDSAPVARPLAGRLASIGPDPDSWPTVTPHTFRPTSEADLRAEADSGAEAGRRRLADRWADAHRITCHGSAA